MARRTAGGVTQHQLAVLADWAEQRLLLISVAAQLEKVMLLAIDDPPVVRAVQDAQALITDRPTIAERLQEPEALPSVGDEIVEQFAERSTPATELPAWFKRKQGPPGRPAPAVRRPSSPPARATPAPRPVERQEAAVTTLDPNSYAVPSLTGVQIALPPRRVPRRGTNVAPSDRELDIIRLVSTGKSNEEIGDELALSRHAVKTQMSKLIARYRCGDRAGLVGMAFRRGWLT